MTQEQLAARARRLEQGGTAPPPAAAPPAPPAGGAWGPTRFLPGGAAGRPSTGTLQPPVPVPATAAAAAFIDVAHVALAEEDIW